MSVRVNRKIVGRLGVIGMVIQMIRLALGILSDNTKTEWFAFIAFFLMAVALKSSILNINKIIDKLTRRKDANK